MAFLGQSKKCQENILISSIMKVILQSLLAAQSLPILPAFGMLHSVDAKVWNELSAIS